MSGLGASSVARHSGLCEIHDTCGICRSCACVSVRSVSNPLNLMNLVWLGVTYAADRTKSFANILTVTFKILADAPNSPLGKLAPEPELPHPPGPEWATARPEGGHEAKIEAPSWGK